VETVRGFSPGAGSTQLSDKRAHHAHSDEPGVPCGAYKLTHYRGKVFIDRFGGGGSHYILRYSRFKLVLWEYIISKFHTRPGTFGIAEPHPYKRYEPAKRSIWRSVYYTQILGVPRRGIGLGRNRLDTMSAF
jgi:hypothetical protein